MGTDCQHRDQSGCRVATQLAERFAETTDGACAHCDTLTPARATNAVTVSLAIHAVKHDAPQRHKLATEYGHLLQPSPAITMDDILTDTGPGTSLFKLLHQVGIEVDEHCKCLARARQMNQWGPAACRQSLDEIVRWMTSEADQRGWKHAKGFQRWGARQLVLIAIRRAEKAA